MTKKPDAIPLSSIFAGDMHRLKFELSHPTMDQKLKLAIEDERDRCAAEFATRQLNQSSINKENGSKPKKRPDVTRAVLESFREEYVIDNGHERGWKKAAMRAFFIDSVNTVNARLKKKE